MDEDEIITGIWIGKYNMFKIPEKLKDFTFKSLWVKINEVFKMPLESSPAFDRYIAYANNIDLFSGAKAASNIFDLQAGIYDSSGNKRSFSEFKDIAKKINIEYNVNYLAAEQDTAINIVNSAKRWETIQETKDQYPLLRYQTVEDGRVRPLHAAWNGIVKPVGDPFWSTRMPPNDWRCRCRVVRVKSGEITSLKNHMDKYNIGVPANERVSNLKNDSELFDVNFGKIDYIFSKKHDYFKIARKFKVKLTSFI